MRPPLVPCDDRTPATGGRRKTHHAPTAQLARLVADSQQPRCLPRRQRDVEAIQRIPKAVALRFDKGLLARPAVEESQRSVAWLEAAIRRVLEAREIACGDVVGVAGLPDGFDVDADRVSA